MNDKNTVARLEYNQICFLLDCVVQAIDKIENTHLFRQEVKLQANRLRKTILPYTEKHQLAYLGFGDVENGENTIPAEQVLVITQVAYEKALEWFTTRPPHHIVSLMTLIEKTEKDFPNLMEEVDTKYTPIDSDLKID